MAVADIDTGHTFTSRPSLRLLSDTKLNQLVVWWREVGGVDNLAVNHGSFDLLENTFDEVASVTRILEMLNDSKQIQVKF